MPLIRSHAPLGCSPGNEDAGRRRPRARERSSSSPIRSPRTPPPLSASPGARASRARDALRSKEGDRNMSGWAPSRMARARKGVVGRGGGGAAPAARKKRCGRTGETLTRCFIVKTAPAIVWRRAAHRRRSTVTTRTSSHHQTAYMLSTAMPDVAPTTSAANAPTRAFRFAIDRGGTFCDVFAEVSVCEGCGWACAWVRRI